MMNRMSGMSGVALVLVLSGASMLGQTVPTPEKPKADGNEVPKRPTNCQATNNCVQQTLYLANSTLGNEQNEITTAMRNILPPESKIYLVPSQGAIVVSATAEQVALAQKLISELDRQKKTFRLTYTVTEMDGTKRINSQHFAIMAVDGMRVTLKQGSKVPIATGSYNAVAVNGSPSGAQTQFTYLDVGMNFDSTLSAMAGGAQLKAKVEQSGIAEEKSGVGAADPVVRQTVFEGVLYLKTGKPLMLGSVDVPGSTRHLDIEAMIEVVP